MQFSTVLLALASAGAAMAGNSTTWTPSGNYTGNGTTATGTASPSSIPTAGAAVNQVGSLLVVAGAAAAYFL